jgi:hypothetical protein
MCAVLAGGEGAVLDMHAAARLHGIERLARRRRHQPITILVTRRHRPISGIDIRRTRILPPGHVCRVDGIPVVTVSRLLRNLAAVEPPSVLCKLIDEAAYLHVLDLDELRSTLCMPRGAPGATKLRHALELYEYGDHGSDSELEELGLALCREFGVRDPQLNAWVKCGTASYRVDQLWHEERVVQELDDVGHDRPTRRRTDAKRRRDLTSEGYVVLRTRREDLADPERRRRAGRRLVQALTSTTVAHRARSTYTEYHG